MTTTTPWSAPAALPTSLFRRGGADRARGARRPRVALYGHDTYGLGHLRRNLALAAALSELDSEPDVLLLCGAAEAGRFPRPPRVDVVTVPAVDKDRTGGYAPAHLSGGLDELLRLRSALLATALTSWSPDLLVVDKAPLGFGRELEESLVLLRRTGRTRMVLGLRDVLDEPAVARAEWRSSRSSEAVREFYDEVWVYGDPALGDLANDCAFPPGVRARTHHVGLLSHGRLGTGARPPGVGDRPYVLGLIGGGRDGGEVAEQFARAQMPAGHVGVLLGGPFLPPEELAALHARAAGRADLLVLPFSDEAQRWVADAAAVVAMGGYNTVAEVLATDTPALLVPRVTPRAEQLVRAERLSRAGLVDMSRPEAAGHPVLTAWLARAVTGARTDRKVLDRDGLTTVAARAAALIATVAGPSAYVPRYAAQEARDVAS